MTGSRSVIQAAYSWQCIGLLILSLTCTTFCHVFRETSYRFNSCANKQFSTCLDNDITSVEKPAYIYSRSMQQFLTEVLKPKALARFQIEKRIRKSQMPKINGHKQVIRDLPVHITSETQLRKYSLLHTEFMKIMLEYTKEISDKQLMNTNSPYLELYYHCLKSFQEAVSGSQLASNYVLNYRIPHNRVLTIYTEKVSKENLHSLFSQTLKSRSMNGKTIRKMCIFKNYPFRDTRLSQVQADFKNILWSSPIKYYRRHSALPEIQENGRIRRESKALAQMHNFSHSVRKLNRPDHIRESRRIMYRSMRKLSGINMFQVKIQAHKYDFSDEMTKLPDGLKMDARNLEIIGIFRIQRQYAESIRNSVFRTYDEGRAISPHSRYCQSTIRTDYEYLNPEINSILQGMKSPSNNTNLQKDLILRISSGRDVIKKPILEIRQLVIRSFKTKNIWAYMGKQVSQRKFYYMGNRETQIDILRQDLFNRRRQIEFWRKDRQNIRFDSHSALEKEIMAEESSAFEIRIQFLLKSMNRPISQHSFPLLPSLENNCGKQRTTSMRKTSGKSGSPKNSSQREIASRKIISKNYRLKLRSSKKNNVLIENQIRNDNQEFGWNNNLPSILQFGRPENKSKISPNDDLPYIYKLYLKNGHNININIRKACNEFFQNIIGLIGLCALHGSFIFGGKQTFFRNVAHRLNPHTAWQGV